MKKNLNESYQNEIDKIRREDQELTHKIFSALYDSMHVQRTDAININKKLDSKKGVLD